MTDVYLEQGRTWTFACTVDWPGWARRGKGDEEALEQLLAYADRYAAVVPGFEPGELHVVGTLPGNATTDFGAPFARGPWDGEQGNGQQGNGQQGDGEQGNVDRLADLLGLCWTAFDRVVAASGPELRKGPRGGGRDRGAIVAHVQEAERASGRSYGVKVPPRTPWPEQRATLDAAIRSGAPGGSWPVRYSVRRTAWHVLDHAWEVEDKQLGEQA